MTVSNVPRRLEYTGDGVTTEFSVTFQFYELAVYLDGAFQVAGVEYETFQLAPGLDGTIIFEDAPGSGTKLVIVGETIRAQGTDYVDNDDFSAEVHEKALDRLTMIVQENAERFDRSLRAPLTAPAFAALDFAANPNTVLYVGGDGVPTLLDASDISSGILEEIEAARDAALAAQAAAELAETHAETAETNAETAETNAVTAKNAALTAKTDAETAATNADTARAAAVVAKVAAQAAAAAALVSEGNAATSASAASASATAAYGYEIAAAASALAAAGSATAASGSATAASGSATAASGSATAAAAALDAFTDIYLGSFAANPTLDNDGNALVEGQLYWNTVSKSLKVYDGAAWQAYSAAAGITSVSVDTAPTLGGNLSLGGFHITGLQIGIDVQAYDADLSAWAGVNPSSYLTTTAAAAAYAVVGRDMIAGAGLTGGGTLAADRTFNVGAGNGINVNANDVEMTVNQRTFTWLIQLDGGGAALLAGIKGYVPVDFAGTIQGWTLIGDVSGSIVIDIWKDTYANALPTVADTITASAKPTISSAIKNTSTTLTGWTTTFAAGDVFGFNVDSASTITKATLALKILKT